MESQLVNLVAYAIVTAVLVIGAKVALDVRQIVSNDEPKVLKMFPDQIQSVFRDASKFAAEYVEKADQAGMFDDVKNKSEEKLNSAVGEAVKYLENILAKNGYSVDIDEEQIKKLIQKYVWDNPDIFPSKKKDQT